MFAGHCLCSRKSKIPQSQRLRHGFSLCHVPQRSRQHLVASARQILHFVQDDKYFIGLNGNPINHYAFALEEELFAGDVPSSRTTFCPNLRSLPDNKRPILS